MSQRFLRAAAAICILAVGVGVLLFAVDNSTAGKKDFIAYWAAGQQLIHGANPYDGSSLLRIEHAAGLDGDQPLIMRNPPVAFFLALPLGLVSAKVGIIFWLLLLIASLLISIRILWMLQGRPDDRIHLLGYLFAPVLACLMAGQLGILLLLGIVLFLRFHGSRPFLAGSALLLCAVKPHLFIPFGLVLLAWVVSQKAYRLLVGILTALLASCALSLCFDPHAWSQYEQMIRAAGVQKEFIPTLSILFRLVAGRNRLWLQFLPAAAGCAWALWYYWRRRHQWNWIEQGLLLLIVSVACAPYAWFTDEAVLLPAVLVAVYRADALDRSLLPFGLATGAALIELLAGVQLTTPFYLWTVPAWLAWYLYASRGRSIVASGKVNATSKG